MLVPKVNVKGNLKKTKEDITMKIEDNEKIRRREGMWHKKV